MSTTFRNVLIGGLVAFAVFSQWQLGQAEALAEANRVRADSIAAEAVVAAFANDSTWEVRFATQSDDLAQAFSESSDTARARLGKELKDANVRIGLLTTVLASAQGEVISVGNRAGSLADSVSTLNEVCVGRWEGETGDDLLAASWSFALPSIQHTLTYTVEIPGEIVIGTAGDGRTIVSARATHPNARLVLDSVFVDAPDPVVVKGLSLRQATLALLLGAFGWELAR